MTDINPPPRYANPRKRDYSIGGVQETFVVPILRDRINWLIAEYCGKLPTPARVLDVGCGRQPFRARLEEIGYQYAGFDVQQTVDNSVDFIGALDEALPPELAGGTQFDFMLCTEVLEHVAHWETAFCNLASLAKTGSHVVITCPHFYPLHEEPYDFWRPTIHAISHFARSNGFTIVFKEAAGDGWDVLGTLLSSCVAVPTRRGLASRVAAKLTNGLRRIGFGILRSGIPQRLARLPGTYLTNIFVLEKR